MAPRAKLAWLVRADVRREPAGHVFTLGRGDGKSLCGRVEIYNSIEQPNPVGRRCIVCQGIVCRAFVRA